MNKTKSPSRKLHHNKNIQKETPENHEVIELENLPERETGKNLPKIFTKNESLSVPEKNENELEFSPKRERKYSNLTSYTERFNLNKPTTSVNSNLFSDKKYRKGNFFLSWNEYLFPLCCFGKNSQAYKKLQIHYKYTSIILKQFDVLNIIPKLHDVDKISYILNCKNYKYGIQNCTNPYLEGVISEKSDIFEMRKMIFKNFVIKEEENNY